MTAPDRVVLAVAVAAGGALGGTARYGVTRIVADGAGGFPWSTLLVNTVGSLVLGSAVAVAATRWPAAHRLLAFAGVGVCGGFTTWSTFMTDAVLLGRDGHGAMAAGYLVVTLVAGLAAMVSGLLVGRRLAAAAGGGGDRWS